MVNLLFVLRAIGTLDIKGNVALWKVNFSKKSDTNEGKKEMLYYRNGVSDFFVLNKSEAESPCPTRLEGPA